MKKVLVLLAATVMLAFAAQAQKIGHFSNDEVMRAMPEYTAAEKSMQEYTDALQKSLQDMKADLDARIAKYTTDRPKLTQAVIEVTERELGSQQQRFQERIQQADSDIQKKQEELMRPIVEKLRKATQAVGAKNGYDYILETSTVHFAKESNDISKLIKTELGIK